MKGFKIAVTITPKKDKFNVLWNKVHLSLDGDKRDLFNLQNQLDLVKKDINTDVNRKGLALKDVHVEIDFI